MAAGRIVVAPYYPAKNRDGELVPGALIYVRVNGTTTPVVTYADEALTTSNPYPVVANGSGQFPAIWVEAGTLEAPIPFEVQILGPDGQSIGNPSNFTTFYASFDYGAAAVVMSENAAAVALDAQANIEATLAGAADVVAGAEGILAAVDGVTGVAEEASLAAAAAAEAAAEALVATEFKVDVSEVGAINGVASLDASGKVPLSQLPTIVGGYDDVNVLDLVLDFGAACDGVTDDGQAWEDAFAAMSGNIRVLNKIMWEGRSVCGRALTRANANLLIDGGEVVFNATAGGITLNQLDNKFEAQRFVGVTKDTTFTTTKSGLHTALYVNYRISPFALRPQAIIEGRFLVDDMTNGLNQAWYTAVRFKNLSTGTIDIDALNGTNAPNSLSNAALRLDGFCVGIKIRMGNTSYFKYGITGEPARIHIFELSNGTANAFSTKPGEDILGNTSGARATLQRNDIAGSVWVLDPVGTFQYGETLSCNGVNLGTLTAFSEDIFITSVAGGTPADGQTFTGATSGASLILAGYGPDEQGNLYANVTRKSTAVPVTGETFNGPGGRTFVLGKWNQKPYGSEGWYVSDTEFVGTDYAFYYDAYRPAKNGTLMTFSNIHSNSYYGGFFIRNVNEVRWGGVNTYNLSSSSSYRACRLENCDEPLINGFWIRPGVAGTGMVGLELRGTCTKPNVSQLQVRGSMYQTGILRGANVLGGVFHGNDTSECAEPLLDYGPEYPGANHAVYFGNVGIADTYRPRGFAAIPNGQTTLALRHPIAQYSINNSSPTTVLGVSGLVAGAEFDLFFTDGQTTLFCNIAGGFALNQLMDVTPPAGAVMRFRHEGPQIREIGRSFPGLEPGWITVDDNYSTPIIKSGRSHYKVSNSSPTLITNFTTANGAQRINLLATNGNTTVQHGTNIFLASGADTLIPNGQIVSLVRDGSIYREVGRSFATGGGTPGPETYFWHAFSGSSPTILANQDAYKFTGGGNLDALTGPASPTHRLKILATGSGFTARDVSVGGGNLALGTPTISVPDGQILELIFDATVWRLLGTSF